MICSRCQKTITPAEGYACDGETFFHSYDCLAGACAVQSTSRQVIENKLLTALEDDGVVAALLNKEDLEVMISALSKYRHRRAEQLAKDMQQLRDAAFP